MPLFMESSSDRAFERMMAAVPGFQSKRYGRKEALTGLAPRRTTPSWRRCIC